MPERAGHRRRSIGIWTSPDPSWSAEAYRRIYERELLARLPDAHIRFVGHLGPDEATVSERGDIITSPAVAADEDGVAFGGLVVAGADLTGLAEFARDITPDSSPHTTPIVLSALAGAAPAPAVYEDEAVSRALAAALDVSVRDARLSEWARSFARSEPVAVVPDPLILLDRLTPPRAARSRIEYLRTMEEYPRAETILVEVSAKQAGHLASLGQSVDDARSRGYRIAVVVLAVDGESMTAELRQCVARAMPAAHIVDQPCLEDRAAMIATAAAIVPISRELLGAAGAFGRPSLWSSHAGWDRQTAKETAPAGERLIVEDFDVLLRLSPEPSAADTGRASIDAHFDRIVSRLAAAPLDASPERAGALARAARVDAVDRLTRRRLADERLRFARQAQALHAENARLKREVARYSALETALREEAGGAVAHAKHESARADQHARRTWQLETDVAQLESARAALADENAAMTKTVADLARENAVQAGVIAELTRQRDHFQAAVERFARSKSWRYLAPARAVGRLVRRVFGIPQ